MKALAAVLVTVVLAGCGEQPAETAPVAAEPSDLALPVTAPMQARERLLHDIGQQNSLAEGRADALDEVIRGNR